MQVQIISTPAIYSPGIFRWVMEAIAPSDKRKAKELLTALNIPKEMISKIMKGKYQHRTEGETLVLIVED